MYNISAIHAFQFSENFLCGLTAAAQHISGNTYTIIFTEYNVKEK